MKDNKQEQFPLVDEEGRVVGSATREECHNGSRLLHPVVHLHVFNSRGEVYLQKRPEWKDIQPGKWDTSVGGHVDYGETPEEALTREVREELGITDFKPERIGSYVYDSRRERELVYVNRTVYDGPVRPSAEELDGGRFWTLDEIRSAIGQGILTPNFESEFQRFFPILKKVRITAVRQTVYQDLMEKFENPIEHTCDVSEGQQWVSIGGTCPEGMCPSAWSVMREFVESLARGEGNFFDGWMKNPMSAMISCNDGFRPFSFYIEVIE